ncbi:hypothetical protein KIPE111705_35080 [Kibdelosporangium persicum]|uniref:Peptidase M14 carboxypeptidase A domain-containing protein n=1 Tax=Kibdelosporangium persicum TaxID=2698649 RepID=A0ABX2EYK6_9PSEU|nr:hypothetical protein [Kibdelosporangium persicum]NRN64077.1 hypothetical protein [Kibdelosporangium persicum]
MSFPHPDEVTARLAEFGPPRQIGRSRLGEPITMVSIGNGPRSALVFAGPHPNEPIGFLTVPRLAESVTRDDLGFTWHLIGCVDPDGARLNEGWYAGPLSRERYFRGFYRPPFDEQVEWTFPDGMPETRALRAVIDEVRPDLMCSLHNGEVGGVFYYVSADRPGLADALADLPTGIPLHVGDAELPGTQRIRPGVFLFPGHEFVPGMSSVHYASQYGTFSLVVEVPLWSDPRSSDTTSSGLPRADVFAEVADMIDDVRKLPELPAVPDSPLSRSFLEVQPAAERFANAMRAHQAEGEATVAERFGLRQIAHMIRLRACATALRIVDGEHRQAFSELFDKWFAEEDSVAEPIPISKLVDTQVGAILSAAKS